MQSVPNFFLVSDGDIDFLTHYKLVDPAKIESYARAFVVEDEDFDTVITSRVRYCFMRIIKCWSFYNIRVLVHF